MATGQAEALMPLLGDLLTEGGLAWADLAGIGVGTGPGNFTGVRIAVAAARGLALALDVPAVGVGVMEALALGQTAPGLVALDARRGQAQVQPFGPGGMAGPPALVAADDPLPFDVPAAPVVLGDLAGALAPRLGGRIGAPVHSLPVAIAQIAAARIAGGGEIDRPAPRYLRGADAAPPRDPPPRIIGP